MKSQTNLEGNALQKAKSNTPWPTVARDFLWKRGGLVLLCIFTFTGCSGERSDAEYIQRLESDNPAVRDHAIAMVSSRQIRASVPKLKGFLDVRFPTQTRIECLQALGRRGATNAVDDTIQVFNTSEGTLKITAAETLGKLGDSRAVPSLVAALKEADVSLVTIWALGQVGDTDSVAPLTALLSADDKYVRYNAHQALKQIGNRE